MNKLREVIQIMKKFNKSRYVEYIHLSPLSVGTMCSLSSVRFKRQVHPKATAKILNSRECHTPL